MTKHKPDTEWDSETTNETAKRVLDTLASVPLQRTGDHKLPNTDEELFRADIEKAREPWFTYYFATTPHHLKKYFTGESDVLLSFSHFLDRKGQVSDKLIPWQELKSLKKSGRRVMLDSGASANLIKPGRVNLDAYVEFLKSSEAREVFNEFTSLDDLTSREVTLTNYVRMLESGLDPLFVDHVFHEDSEPNATVWKNRSKVCVSGLSKRLAGQADPKTRLSEMMKRGGEMDTKVHILAASSPRKFLAFADRIDSVDSATWLKSSAFSMYMSTEFREVNGVMIPIQRVNDRPDSNRRGATQTTKEESRRVQARVHDIRKEFSCSARQGFLRFTIEETRKYVSALNALNPSELVEAYTKTKTSKAYEKLAERGAGFAFLSETWGDREFVLETQVSEQATEDEVKKLDPTRYNPANRDLDGLRSDWGLISKLWAGYKQQGDAEYTRDEMIALAGVIVSEIVKRGPESMVFNIEAMGPDEAELWGAVVRLVRPPADMVSKEVITPETDFDSMGPDALLAAHRDLHKIGTRVAASRVEVDWSWEELVDAHGRIVEALDGKGYAHPEARGLLDAASSSFEKTDAARHVGKSSATMLSKIEAGLDEAAQVLAGIEPGVVRKMKAPSGASRPLEAVAVEKMIIATGVPGDWSPMSAAALGSDRRRRLLTFWNKSTPSTRRFLRKAHDEFVEKSAGGAINSGSAAKKNSAQYVSHVHYRGNRADLVIRLAKSGEGRSLETWTLPLSPLEKSVTSLATARELLRDGLAPLPRIGEVSRVKRSPDSPSGWLTSEGVTPPGAYGSSGSAPGVFHLVERGEFTMSEGNEIRVLKFTPETGDEPRLLTLRRIPISEVHLESRGVSKVLNTSFDDPNLPNLIKSFALEDGGRGTWVGRFVLSTTSPAKEKATEKAAYDGINFTPPAGVREEIRRGLAWHEEGHSGDGLVPATVTWATRLANGEDISPEKARKMRAWLARHESDKSGKGFSPGEDGFPSPGRVAWALWGGDPAVGWSSKLVEQMESREEKKSETEGEHLPESISKILKAEKRLVVGIVLQPDVVDAQDDIIGSEEIEQAAHNFLAKYNRETQMGFMHKVFGDVGVDLVESYVTPAPLELGGKKVRKGTWIMTVKVRDDELWGMVKSGKITGFSIGGLACSKET